MLLYWNVVMRFGFFLLALLVSFAVQSRALCPAVDWDETVILQEIIDGDTVRLDNGRLVRFIGINTAEINYRNINKSEPYALEAKALLQRTVRQGDKLHLVYDKTKQDKYGRKLAYVYSKTGQNLGLLQLQAGFAEHWVVGKNDKFWRCFQEAQMQAKKRQKGRWDDFKPLSARHLQAFDKGYKYVYGRITDIQNNNKGLQLLLDNHLVVLIQQSNLDVFQRNAFKFVLHDKLQLTGKVYFSQKRPYIKLYHPAQILP